MKHHFHIQISPRPMLVCMLLLSAGCASTGKVNQVDPYESFNRPVHSFNSKVDRYVAKPISDAYRYITPEFMQKGVNNFFNNLQEVNVILNDLLQAKLRQSAQDAGRLTLNSTLGIGGLVDVASKVGLEKHNEDFGQTLAVWGLPQGSYLVLPFLGPSTFRELPGYVVDTVTNPSTYLGGGVALPLASVSAINSRANAEGSLQFINEAALDPYVFMRESYLQWRNYQVNDGKISQDPALDDIEDELMSEGTTSTPKTPQQSNLDTKIPEKEHPDKPDYGQSKQQFETSYQKLQVLKAKKNQPKQSSPPDKSRHGDNPKAQDK